MPVPVVGPIDYQKNEAQNLRVHNLAGAPTSPAVGQIYVETTAGVNRLYVWNGASWVLKATDSDALSGQTLAQVRDFSQTTGQRTATSAISNFDTQVRTSSLDQMAVPQADLNMNGKKLTGLAAAVSGTDAPTLSQVQGLIDTGTNKSSVRAASTANVTLASPGATIDGVTLVSGDRVLLKNQTTGSENGIWIWNGAAAAMTRATDADISAEVRGGLSVWVNEGTVNADTRWVLTTDTVVLGTTSLTFVQDFAASATTAGAGLTATGGHIDVGAGTGIVVNPDTVQIDTAVVCRKAIAQIGDGAATSYNVAHNFNNQWVQATVWENTGTFRLVMGVEIRALDANTTQFIFPTAPAVNAYRVVIQG